MLVRHMFGYAPSLVLTAILSFASLSFFTHYMDRADFGQYSLAVAAMTMLIGVCFFWLQSAASRLLPQAVQEGREMQFTSTLYGAFAVCSVVLLILPATIGCSIPLGDWQVAVWFAPPLAILRALLNLNQAGHRNFLRIARYNIIEVGQAVIGLIVSMILVVAVGMGASGPVIGTMTGLLAMALFDWRMLRQIHWRHFDWNIFKEIAQFGWPFIANSGFSFVLASSDRFLIEHFLGPDQVGIYSAGYAIPDRVGQYLFMAVATASFPLLVRRMEQEGPQAARDQTYTNGIALLALAVPACIGLLLINRQIAAVLIGRDFRDGAVHLMPWIATAMIMNGLAAHYFDHAFHLAKKTRLFFLTLGPAALLNFVGNMYAIPAYGIMGAAYTTLASYALYLALSIIIGRHVFPIKFPFLPALHILISTAIMALVLLAFHFPSSLFGLIEMVLIGGTVYGLGVLCFDILGTRTYLEKKMQERRSRFCIASTGLSFEIIRDPQKIERLAPEWNDLYLRVKRDLFGSHDWHQIWWRNLGASSGAQLRIFTARANGRLVALLPLAVRRSGLARIAEWAGYDVFDFGDVLAESPHEAKATWQFATQNRGYDIALIKDVRGAAHSASVLPGLMRLREEKRNYFLTLDFTSGEAWLAAQSRKLRGDIRRKREKMQTGGAIVFHVSRNADTPTIDALYRQKAAWFKERGAVGVFARPEVKPFLHDLAKDAAGKGMLYLATLSCGDEIVACHMGFVRDRALHLYLTTYDAAFGAYSPGNIMMVETIQWAIDNGMPELDFMRGDESYKQRFASGHRPLFAYVASGSWLGKAALLFRQSSETAKAENRKQSSEREEQA